MKTNHQNIPGTASQLDRYKYHEEEQNIIQTTHASLALWSYYRMAKFKSAESTLCNSSSTSMSKWWNFELQTESLVWHPGKIIDQQCWEKINAGLLSKYQAGAKVIISSRRSLVSSQLDCSQASLNTLAALAEAMSLMRLDDFMTLDALN